MFKAEMTAPCGLDCNICLQALKPGSGKFERGFEHALEHFVSSKEIHQWNGYGIS